MASPPALLPAAASEALQAFASCPGWDQRARLQMQWGERLEPLSAEQCCNEHLVQGCASHVWLLDEEHEGRWSFQAASDARLLRGLLALLLELVEGVLYVTLNRPDSRNAMSLAMVGELRATLEAVRHEPNVRALVLRSALAMGVALLTSEPV